MIRPQEALQELLDSEEYHSYLLTRDPRNPLAEWRVFGDCRHDFLWIALVNMKTEQLVVQCVQSPITDIPMKIRSEGLEEAEAVLVETFAQHMWERHSKSLKL